MNVKMLIVKKFRSKCLPLIAALALAGGCQSARMAVPPALEQHAEVWPCVGRGSFSFSEKFSFGGYRVDNVKRGWTRRVTWGIAFYEHSTARQEFEYEMQTPSGAIWHCQAVTGVKKGDVKGEVAGGELTVGVSHDLNFVARMARGDVSNAWTLVMGENEREMLMQGILSGPDGNFRVEVVHRLVGTHIQLMDPAGYMIYNNSTPVAAVDVLNAGSVRIAGELNPEQRDALAAAAAALLLFRDISGS